ncbi:hypothetical protein WA158_001822 [Blastocystis sp. Blastoise]
MSYDLSSWKGKHVISVKPLTKQNCEEVIYVAEKMRDLVAKQGGSDILHHRILANVFLEPSTRTASSFATAFMRLGGKVVSVGADTSSTKKGETLQDTMRCVQCYADCIVLRHPMTGAASIASKYLEKPFLNAGDGAGEHPSQALLDLVTINKEIGHIEGITVTMVGDLLYGRTVHSLARLLAFYNVKLNYVAPNKLQMPDEVYNEVAAKGIQQHKTEVLSDDILAETDILYVTRVQQERFESQEEYKKYHGVYIIGPDTLAKCKSTVRVMHPLPRIGEILESIDHMPQAAFFREMENGMFTRMALISLVMGVAEDVVKEVDAL